jgi:hypothetical protein
MHKINSTHTYRFEDTIYKIKDQKYCYKFEIKYCDEIVSTDPFNYTIVVVHDLVRQDSVLSIDSKQHPI